MVTELQERKKTNFKSVPGARRSLINFNGMWMANQKGNQVKQA